MLIKNINFLQCIHFGLASLSSLSVCIVFSSFIAKHWILSHRKHSLNYCSSDFPPKVVWHIKPSYNLCPVALSFSQKIINFSLGVASLSYLSLCIVFVQSAFAKRISSCVSRWSCLVQTLVPQTRADFLQKAFDILNSVVTSVCHYFHSHRKESSTPPKRNVF